MPGVVYPGRESRKSECHQIFPAPAAVYDGGRRSLRAACMQVASDALVVIYNHELLRIKAWAPQFAFAFRPQQRTSVDAY